MEAEGWPAWSVGRRTARSFVPRRVLICGATCLQSADVGVGAVSRLCRSHVQRCTAATPAPRANGLQTLRYAVLAKLPINLPSLTVYCHIYLPYLACSVAQHSPNRAYVVYRSKKWTPSRLGFCRIYVVFINTNTCFKC